MRINSVGGAVAIAVVVLAATSFLLGRLSGPDTVPPEAGVAGFKEALRDVERSLADIRLLLTSLPTASGPVRSPAPELRAAPSGPSRAGSGIPSPGDEPLTAPRPAPPRETTGSLLPAADLSRAEEINEWESNEDVRRRWFLVSEADALAVFGTPTRVSEWGSGERWDYEGEEWSLTLCFLRGRLVNVYSTDKRRR